MKKWIAMLLAACMLLACTAALADAQWAEDNGLNKTETVEELYQAALAEGGVLNRYHRELLRSGHQRNAGKVPPRV